MQDLTTLVCLFHRGDHAQAAAEDLRRAGIPETAIRFIDGDGEDVDALDKSDLASLGMPDRDYDHLKAGIRDGGVVLAVSATAEHEEKVESIFSRHSAEKIDEAEREAPRLTQPNSAAAGAIPVIEESLAVGKRTVDQGGVRLYRRVVEIPVEESVSLREEHVSVDRIPVDRPVSESDLPFQPRTIELTETAEEVVRRERCACGGRGDCHEGSRGTHPDGHRHRFGTPN